MQAVGDQHDAALAACFQQAGGVDGIGQGVLGIGFEEQCRDDAEYRCIVEAGKAYVGANYSAERIDGLLRQACAAE